MINLVRFGFSDEVWKQFPDNSTVISVSFSVFVLVNLLLPLSVPLTKPLPLNFTPRTPLPVPLPEPLPVPLPPCDPTPVEQIVDVKNHPFELVLMFHSFLH